MALISTRHIIIIDMFHTEAIRNDIKDWCEENLIGNFRLWIHTRGRLVYNFEIEDDAFAFKLTWM